MPSIMWGDLKHLRPCPECRLKGDNGVLRPNGDGAIICTYCHMLMIVEVKK